MTLRASVSLAGYCNTPLQIDDIFQNTLQQTAASYKHIEANNGIFDNTFNQTRASLYKYIIADNGIFENTSKQTTTPMNIL